MRVQCEILGGRNEINSFVFGGDLDHHLDPGIF